MAPNHEISPRHVNRRNRCQLSNTDDRRQFMTPSVQLRVQRNGRDAWMVTLQQRNAPSSSAAGDSSSPGRRRHRRHREQSTAAADTTGAPAARGTATPTGVPLTPAQIEKRRLALQRKFKTNLLLVMIAVVFALSCAPVAMVVPDAPVRLSAGR